MSSAVLRGFDYLATDLEDGIRFCHPILSFEAGDSAPMYLARTMDWEYDAEHGSRWLTPISSDQVEYFGTLTSERLTVERGHGVVVIGHRFAAKVREIGSYVDYRWSVKVGQVADGACLIGVADVQSFEHYVQELTMRARSVFDHELTTINVKGLSWLAEDALFVLVNCSTTSHLCVAKYKLAATIARNDRTSYRRLLPMFALELNKSDDELDICVREYVRSCSGELFRRWSTAGKLSGGRIGTQEMGAMALARLVSRETDTGMVRKMVDAIKEVVYAVNELEDAVGGKYVVGDLGGNIAGLSEATAALKGDGDTAWTDQVEETGDFVIGTTSSIMIGRCLEFGEEFGRTWDLGTRSGADDLIGATHGTRQKDAVLNYFRKGQPWVNDRRVGSLYP